MGCANPLFLVGPPHERFCSGARRTEVRWILGLRRRADPPRRRTHRGDQEAGQRRRRGGLGDGRHHRRPARPGQAGLSGAAAAGNGHAADRRRADLQRAGRDGHRLAGRAGPVVHRVAGRRDHHRHPRQRQDHRRHARPAAVGARRGPDRARRRLPGRQPGQQGRHHARPRRVGHHRRRTGRGAERRRLRDLHRRRRHLHRRPAHRAQRPAAGHRVVRGDARARRVRRQGADAALRGICPPLQRSGTRPVVVFR